STRPPAPLSAVFGECSRRSCTTLSFETPPSCGSISHVTRLASSAACDSSQSDRQEYLSLCGGADSRISPSVHFFSRSGDQPRIGLPASRVEATRPPQEYLLVNSGLVMASQICSGLALMKTV